MFGGRGIYQLPLSTTLGGLRQPIFKLQREFHLMPTNDASVNTAPQTESALGREAVVRKFQPVFGRLGVDAC